MKIELYNDHFENAKRYQIPRAQLIIADIPYNIGINAYGGRIGTLEVTTKTVKAIKRERNSLTRTKISKFITFSSSARGFSGRSRRKEEKHRV